MGALFSTIDAGLANTAGAVVFCAVMLLIIFGIAWLES